MRWQGWGLVAGVVVSLCGCAGDGEEATVGASAQVADVDLSDPSVLVGPKLALKARVEQSGVSLHNAYWLAAVDDAIYLPKKDIPGALKKFGFEATQGNVFRYWLTPESDRVFAAYLGTPQWGILAFRGSKTERDWSGNLDLDQVKVGPGSIFAHKGWDGLLETSWRSIRETLRANNHASDSPKPLYLTGHSLGGALAVQAAFRALYDGCRNLTVGRDAAGNAIVWQRSPLSIEQLAKPNGSSSPLDWGVAPDGSPLLTQSCREDRIAVDGIYTFGQPKVGNPSFVEAMTRRFSESRTAYFHFDNEGDLVPLVPPSLEDAVYIHIGSAGIAGPRSRMFLRSDGRLVRGAPEATVSVQITTTDAGEDHALSLYMQKILANLEAEQTGNPVVWPPRR